MPFLTPSSAAAIARAVYRLREDSVSTVVRDRGQLLGCEGMFAVGDDACFIGRTGGLGFGTMSGFG